MLRYSARTLQRDKGVVNSDRKCFERTQLALIGIPEKENRGNSRKTIFKEWVANYFQDFQKDKSIQAMNTESQAGQTKIKPCFSTSW